MCWFPSPDHPPVSFQASGVPVCHAKHVREGSKHPETRARLLPIRIDCCCQSAQSPRPPISVHIVAARRVFTLFAHTLFTSHSISSSHARFKSFLLPPFPVDAPITTSPGRDSPRVRNSQALTATTSRPTSNLYSRPQEHTGLRFSHRSALSFSLLHLLFVLVTPSVSALIGTSQEMQPTTLHSKPAIYIFFSYGAASGTLRITKANSGFHYDSSCQSYRLGRRARYSVDLESFKRSCTLTIHRPKPGHRSSTSGLASTPQVSR